MIYLPVQFHALCPLLSRVALSFNSKCLIMPHATLLMICFFGEALLTSSNINEVIKAVLNVLFFFFFEKISHTLKALKAIKTLKDTKTLGQKHKNANKRISDYFSP